ncbi:MULTISPECIES: IclR family transcriptional regulator [Paraburkholderia]|jgi:DNA-binding IclR family transcriptional regulator|uniref:Helix-turn-helix domain-containing protein n=1 Tax=Paraburkholderia madseniana TaxID=2599607 RepID=A0A6N6W9I8_9BURK|nr:MULTISPECIES: IclR family transcriptional regulator C-terminal domain-containing protein [Paraburkholderia]KAE8757123.1 helix-turn-helix domain-containing protein [Paraburkholderia madseniana]MCX4149399.1 helix-turn-helix domain-containing protein [Paraburkholderia madseniana]MCX4175825.1 helix-turn-helix domain-containing protein [Paraburkholderia madseniana]MDN7152334.1 helix-turn-helix domain-containing protein [Paraburkholderia sp. WS6]MDQ6411216.1 helix-turn-helix domain-containing pro
MAASDRSLSVLKLFTVEHPEWTAEDVAAALDVGIATAYRYLSALDEAGLIATTRPGRYGLGPAITQLDRQLQLTDPLLIAARPVMNDLSAYAPPGSVVLLCRAVGESVLCIHRVHAPGSSPAVSYERGRPMPLFYGATSKMLLAYLPPRRVKALFEKHTKAIAKAGLGKTLPAFRSVLGEWRKAGSVVTRGEVDTGLVGIAAAILSADRTGVGSISYVVTGQTDEKTIARLAALVSTGAREIEMELRDETAAVPS